MAKVMVSTTPEAETIPRNELRDFDREALIKLFVAYGIHPVKVEGDDRQIVCWFKHEDIAELENRYYRNDTVLVDWKMVVQTVDWWANLVVSWKSLLRYENKNAT